MNAYMRVVYSMPYWTKFSNVDMLMCGLPFAFFFQYMHNIMQPLLILVQ